MDKQHITEPTEDEMDELLYMLLGPACRAERDTEETEIVKFYQDEKPRIGDFVTVAFDVTEDAAKYLQGVLMAMDEQAESVTVYGAETSAYPLQEKTVIHPYSISHVPDRNVFGSTMQNVVLPMRRKLGVL